MSDTPPFTTFRFEVVLDLENAVAGLTSPLCDAAFAECDGLEMTMEPKTVDRGGLNYMQTHLIGPIKYSQVTLKRGMTSNLQLWTWMALAGQGTVAPATGTIYMWDTDGTPVIKFGLQSCLPVRMRAPSLNAREGLVAIEELSLVHERLTVTAVGNSGLGAAAVGSVSAGISVATGLGATASASISGGASVSGGAQL